MRTYDAFALRINSELIFPELLSCSNLGLADVTIKWGDVSPLGLDLRNQSNGLFYQATPVAIWIHVPQVARFLISHGNQIIVDPMAGVDEDSIRVFILGSCMGALLMQRNLLLLHGNAIKVGDHCISFVGQSGAGKSTLSGAFFKRGYSVLADDVCAVNVDGQVVPSFPQIKLWFDAAKQLNIDTQSLRKIRPSIEKYAIPLAQQFHPNALPLRMVYVLHAHNQEVFQFTAITGMNKVQPLLLNTYRRNYLKDLQKETSHFKQCAQIASQTHMVRIDRPKDGFRLDELVDLIQANLQQLGYLDVMEEIA